MRLRPRAALRHSQGVGVQAPPSRCLSDRATRKAVLQRPDYLAPVRSTEATHALSRLSTHYWFTAETPSKGGTFLERNIADTYVILDARRAGALGAYALDGVPRPPAATRENLLACRGS